MDTFGARVAACLALERDACSPRDSRKSFSPRFQFLSTKTLAGPRDLAMSPTPVRSPADGSLPPLSLSSRLESVIAPLRTRHHTKMSPVQRVRTHMALGEEGKRAKSRCETRCKDVAEEAVLNRKMSKKTTRKYAERQKTAEVEKGLLDQFQTGRVLAAISSRPGQCGRSDGYILEGKELEFYLRKIKSKKGK